MWPPKEKYITTIVGALTNVSKTIITASQICDFKGELLDTEKYGHNIETTEISSEPLDSEREKFLEFETKILQEYATKSEIKKPILKPREGIVVIGTI
jgi:hypothetical protein